jgi:excisionase family DNA binding protein
MVLHRTTPSSMMPGAMSDRTSNRPQQDVDRTSLSVPEAAKELGITPDAVRARLHRGSLAGVKVGGTWRVFLPRADEPPTGKQQDATGTRPDPDRTTTDALVAALQDRIESLERQLAHRTEESRNKDFTVAQLVQHVAALSAGERAPTVVDTLSMPAGTDPHTTPQERAVATERDVQPMRASETLIDRLRRLIGR